MLQLLLLSGDGEEEILIVSAVVPVLISFSIPHRSSSVSVILFLFRTADWLTETYEKKLQ